MAKWVKATRHAVEDNVIHLKAGDGYVQKVHSNTYRWYPVDGTAVEFVSNVGHPNIGGAIVIDSSGIPTYMQEALYAATYVN